MINRSFETDDVFDRKKFAELLKIMIDNPDHYRKNKDTVSLTIAINAPWGMGKTHFVDMLADMLKKEENYNVIFYNAWKYDFWNNAFDPLMQSILTNEKISQMLDQDEIINEDFVAKIKAISKILAIGGIKGLVGKIFDSSIVDETLTDAIKECQQTSANRVAFPELENYQNYIEFLKNTLGRLVRSDKEIKHIVILDELDRCLPLFSIQTLEIVKHLFDVEGLTFILSLDMTQLGHSVKSLYGEGIDSEGYLIRFFDYILNLPNPAIEIIIQEFLKDPSFKEISINKRELTDHMVHIAKKYKVSIREIPIILTNFQMLAILDKKCTNIDLFKNYYSMIVIKYKQLTTYEMMQTNSLNFDMFEKLKGEKVLTELFSSMLCSNDTISRCILKQSSYKNGSRKISDAVFIVKVDSRGVVFSKNPIVHREKYLMKSSPEAFQIINEEECYNDFITYSDIKQWENKDISKISVTSFIFRKLEMASFI